MLLNAAACLQAQTYMHTGLKQKKHTCEKEQLLHDVHIAFMLIAFIGDAMM